MSYLIKILVAGESGVGKTTLIQRYLSDRWVIGTKSTIGIDFFLKKIKGSGTYLINGLKSDEELNLQIWDTSGEEKFREVLPLYSAGTQGIFLCFDITRPETLKKLHEWDDVLKDLINDPVPKILIATKCDLPSKISKEVIKEFQIARNIDLKFDTSSKDGTNVQKIFTDIANAIFTQLNS
ncbi:MAG: Rab family GTPase [Candidatus Thorarchaeota archaeon]